MRWSSILLSRMKLKSPCALLKQRKRGLFTSYLISDRTCPLLNYLLRMNSHSQSLQIEWIWRPNASSPSNSNENGTICCLSSTIIPSLPSSQLFFLPQVLSRLAEVIPRKSKKARCWWSYLFLDSTCHFLSIFCFILFVDYFIHSIFLSIFIHSIPRFLTSQIEFHQVCLFNLQIAAPQNSADDRARVTGSPPPLL